LVRDIIKGMGKESQLGKGSRKKEGREREEEKPLPPAN
jgi:hypothetical protein